MGFISVDIKCMTRKIKISLLQNRENKFALPTPAFQEKKERKMK